MSTGATHNSANFVVEMVCDVCRIEGFSIETNVQADSESQHFIDIVASKRARKKSQKVAFECWEGDRQVNGKEVENFVQRLKTFGLATGIYVSPKGFTGDAEFVARKLGVELWDLAKLKDRVHKLSPPEKARVPGTLPVARDLPHRIFSSHLTNGHVMRLASLPKLEFRPYYFAKFDSLGGKKKAGKGVLVLDGVDGRVCDAAAFEGHLEHLPSTGLFVECLDLQPSVGSLPKLPTELEMKNSVTIAPAGVAPDRVMEVVKGTLEGEAQISHDHVNITDLSILHVPLVTVELTAGGKAYRKILQAATGKMIWDETWKCSFCEGPSKAVCEVCGGTTCLEHMRQCSSCRKHLCTNCVTSKGVLSKHPLCPTCKKA